MTKKKKFLLIIFVITFIAIMFIHYNNSYNQSNQTTQMRQNNLFNKNKKVAINENYSFIFKFVTKPKIGEVVVKIEILDNQENKVNNLKVYGSYDMPAMRGGHASGEQLFMLNQKGSYLLPVHIAMSGKWEIVISIKENNNEIYQGTILLNI